ncbi:MAG TPA: NCS2 family permease [Bacillota bacterium]|nr:NCS2 family permease [Bacillota bacterium]
MENLLAAIAVVINGIPQGLLAMSFGFAALPSALAFASGLTGAFIFRSVAPISFQAESIVLAGTMGRDRFERCTIVFLTGIIMIVVGGLGLIEPTIRFIGPAIENGMMAGVGIILAVVAVNMLKKSPLVGASSVLTAVLVYAFFDGNLVYTIVTSVVLATAVNLASRKRAALAEAVDLSIERIRPIKLVLNSPNVIRGTLAMVCFQIGGNIVYAGITGAMAGVPVNVDHVTLYSGVGDALSGFFGGGPVEAIISGTGAAPDPWISGMLMMGIMGVILAARLLPVLARYIPSESIAGFLFVLGAIVAFPINIRLAVAADPVLAGVVTVVTAATDPFIGLVTGVVVRWLFGLAGM